MSSFLGEDYDPNDPDDVHEAQRDQLAYDVVRKEAWRQLMATPNGRILVAELLRESGFFRSSYSENPLNAAFMEGKRSIGAAIYHIVMLQGPAYWPEIHALVHQLPIPPRPPEAA